MRRSSCLTATALGCGQEQSILTDGLLSSACLHRFVATTGTARYAEYVSARSIPDKLSDSEVLNLITQASGVLRVLREAGAGADRLSIAEGARTSEVVARAIAQWPGERVVLLTDTGAGRWIDNASLADDVLTPGVILVASDASHAAVVLSEEVLVAGAR